MSLCLHEKMFRIAEEFPDTYAVMYEKNNKIEHMTFGELAEKSLKLAGNLREAGVKKGDFVAVRMPRGTGQVISVYAILAVGAVYVPINVRHPAGRVENICKKGNINFIVTDMNDMDYLGLKKISISDNCNVSADEIVYDSDSLAYVIFTSGSTGEPKGVMIKHSSAMNTINDVNERFAIGKDDTAINLSEIDFDLSVYDMFGIINAGGKLFLLNENNRRDPEKWLRLVEENNITVWNSVPAIYEMLMTVAEGKNKRLPLKKIMLSGDWIALNLPQLTDKYCDNAMFISLGGATEASIWSNYYIVNNVDKNWKSIPYGTALSGQELMVVDSNGSEAEAFQEGELHIGGKGVAEGYLQDKTLTESSFYTKNGQRWYKTGDLAVRDNDGIYYILGRTDYQVKINGYRIELGEIENTINNIHGISQSVVMVSKSKKIMTAYSLNRKHPDECKITSQKINNITSSDKQQRKDYTANVMCYIMGLENGKPRSLSDYSSCNQAYLPWIDFLVSENYAFIENDCIKAIKENTLTDAEKAEVSLLKDVFYGLQQPETILESDIFAPEKLIIRSKETEYLLKEILSADIDSDTEIAVLDSRKGSLAKEIIRIYPNVRITLFDRSQGMLESAKDELAENSSVAGFVRYTDYVADTAEKGKFDIVISADTLHTWNEPEHALLIAENLLRPSGRFYAVEYSEIDPMGLITSALIENGFVSDGQVDMPFRNENDWAEILKSSGFSKTEIVSIADSDAFFIKAEASDQKIIPDFRTILSGKLTAYMIPDSFTEFLWYPLTENGKTDRKKISEILSANTEKSEKIELEGTALEVWKIWKEYLGSELDSTEKNFFEAGGDSLLATRLLVKIQKQFGVEVSLAEMLDNSTISGMSELIDRKTEETGDVLEGEI